MKCRWCWRRAKRALERSEPATGQSFPQLRTHVRDTRLYACICIGEGRLCLQDPKTREPVAACSPTQTTIREPVAARS
eukprot:1143545-Prorocentrum_lima.AAC.1